MLAANENKSTALPKANHRTRHPANKPTASTTSAIVAAHPNTGTNPAGTNGSSNPVYFRNSPKFPQATFVAPGTPHNPNRSATADRKENASAILNPVDAR